MTFKEKILINENNIFSVFITLVVTKFVLKKDIGGPSYPPATFLVKFFYFIFLIYSLINA